MMGMTHEDDCAPLSRGMAFLRQDVSHMCKIRKHETSAARYMAALERAAQVLVDGDEIERATISKQITDLLDRQADAG